MSTLASVIVASFLLIVGTVGALLLAGHSLGNFFILPPALAILSIPLGCTTLAFGVRGPAVVFRSLATCWQSKEVGTPEVISILSAFIGYVYGAGAFVVSAGLISVLGCLTESGPTPGFRGNVTATIVAVIYVVVLAEIVLRPLKHRLSCARP